MKKITPLFFLILALAISFDTMGSDTLYFRFSNVVVRDASPNDTLIFDIDIKSSTSSTYLAACQVDFNFNPVVFGNSAVPVSITHLAMVGPDMIVGIGNSTGNSSYRYAISTLFAPYNPANLSLVPSSSWGKLLKVKMLVINNSQNVGVQFNTAQMAGTEKFVLTLTSTLSPYSPIIASNNILGTASTPTPLNLMISELGDPSNSSADFVEIYNPGATMDLNLTPWFLTVYNGSTYQNVQLTGAMNFGTTNVTGSTAFASNYPGKTSTQTSGIVEQNGTVTWYLTLLYPYPTGILADKYDGTSLPFTAKHAVRKYPVASPNATFTSGEWSVTPAVNMDMTPGSHRATLNWDGSTDIDWFDTANWTPSYVPDAGHNAQVPVFIVPPPTVATGSSANVHNVVNGASK